ncbi:DUF4386 domain-containing protein [Hyphobacterium sp. HN65]|uniref:DUF4386 domain-containing protein n=1 Tax=Hyphobacterium lacteum TaxID=3116575 RepID=A0ABU7LS81_9PROT|nr:DUF4386 domain-containing protein [Hyphobacterium sp. HN65]MEE2526501.1 DUF4386 domain-containing protein [Hyphobacterium sp. HN65]
MTPALVSRHPVSLARLSGLAYVIIILSGIFAQIVVRGGLIDWQDASATALAIQTDDALFRLGILADFLVFALDIFLAVTFYRLFVAVDRGVALFALSARLVMSAVMVTALLAETAPLLLLGDTPIAGQLDPEAAGVWSLVFLGLHNEGYILGLMLFGLHCGALGILLTRSRYFPTFLGLLMGLSGLSYVALGVVHFGLPALSGVGGMLLLPAALPEFVFAGWLLVRGLNRRQWQAQIEADGSHSERT